MIPCRLKTIFFAARRNPYAKGLKKQATIKAPDDTAHLEAIPGMVDSILTAQAEPLEECTPYDPNENWS